LIISTTIKKFENVAVLGEQKEFRKSKKKKRK